MRIHDRMPCKSTSELRDVRIMHRANHSPSAAPLSQSATRAITDHWKFSVKGSLDERHNRELAYHREDELVVNKVFAPSNYKTNSTSN